jgi:hypothetical protein
MPKSPNLDSHARAYARDIRAAVYGLWNGSLDLFSFVDSMGASIRSNYTRAWQDAARSCETVLADLDSAALEELEFRINSELQYTVQFGQDILASDKQNKGKLAPHVKRIAAWANTYYGVYSHALAFICEDKRAVWVLGRTREHCTDCVRLNGRVYTLKTWRSFIEPGSRSLEC